jgi:methylmalonyl-CoA/ethylmalonyl-CoA epimerase
MSRDRAWHVTGLHHVAFAHDGTAADVPGALGDLLGLSCSHSESAAGFTERMLPVGNGYLQLLEATGPGVIDRFIERRGAGLHHVALEVSDLDQAVSDLRGRGARMIDDAPRPGGMGTRIAFVHPSSCHGLLLELVESSPAGLAGTRDLRAGRS